MRIISDSESFVFELLEGTDHWYICQCSWSTNKLLNLVPDNHPWLLKAFEKHIDFKRYKNHPENIDKDVVLDVLFGIDILMDVELGDDYYSIAIDVTTDVESVNLKLKKNQDPIRVNILKELCIQHHLLVVVPNNMSYDALSTEQKRQYINSIERAVKSLKSVVYLD
jgi:hypothetical protein